MFTEVVEKASYMPDTLIHFKNGLASRGFERKYHLLIKLLDSSCTETLNLGRKGRLRYQDPVVELVQLKKQSQSTASFQGVQAWSKSNVLPILGVALCGVLFRQPMGISISLSTLLSLAKFDGFLKSCFSARCALVHVGCLQSTYLFFFTLFEPSH